MGENAAPSTVVGTVAATDPDRDDLTHSVGGTDAAAFNEVFVMDPATGRMTVRAGASPDYETKASYSLTVRVTDGENASGRVQVNATADDTVAVTMTVTDLEEPGVVVLSGDTVRVEVPVTATLSDPDGSTSEITWQWQKSATETGTFDDIGGATSDEYTPAGGDQGAWLRAEASYTDRRGPSKNAASPAREVLPPPYRALVSNIGRAHGNPGEITPASETQEFADAAQGFTTGSTAEEQSSTALTSGYTDPGVWMSVTFPT